MSPRGSAAAGTASGSLALLCILLALVVAAFALTRAARSQDDLVHTVKLSPEVSIAEARAEPALVGFSLARDDAAVTVEIIDGRGGSDGAHVRTLAADLDLARGPHELEWDARDDEGGPVPAGTYALRVVLGEADRRIQPPGRIEVVP